MCSHIKSYERQYDKSIGEIKYNLPTIQRSVIETSIAEIYDFQVAFYEKHGKYCISGSLSIVISDGVSYLVDGQHRMMAYKLLIQNYPDRPLLINIDVYEGDVEQIYKLVNTQKPNDITRLDLDSYKVINDLEKYLKTNFKEYLKTTGTPRKPNFNFDHLKNYLITNNIISKIGPSFIDRMIELNKFYACIPIEKFAEWGVKLTNNDLDKYPTKLYLGYYSKFEWVDRLLDMTNFADLIHISYDYRPKITKELKKVVWDSKEMEANCYTCDKKIHYEDFECGHIIPLSRGGKTTRDNLRRICSLCNNNMRTMNLEEYKILVKQQVGEI